jgi:cell division transport system permease protein
VLKAFRGLASYHLQAASSSLHFLCRKPMATLMTVIVIAITLTLPALFWVFSDNLQNMTRNWERGGHISLYLKPSLPAQEQTAVFEHIQSMEGVGKISLKSSLEGLKELQAQEGMHDILRYLPENPLPAVIEVIPALTFAQPFQVQQLFTRLQALPQVEQAKLDMKWITRLHAILGFASKTAHAVMALLASAVVLIIGNTLRLAIHNRQEEIQVLKLIGATDPYIARPFLYSGIWYSLAGAVLAVLFVNIFMLSFAVAIKQLASAYQMHYPTMGLTVKQAYSLVLVATALGWLGARLSVNRQLASIEPYN